MHRLGLLLLLFLLPLPAAALTTYVHRVVPMLGITGDPVGSTRMGEVRFGWDGSVKGPGAAVTEDWSEVGNLSVEVQNLAAELGLPADEPRRIYITPLKAPGQTRVAAVTREQDGIFRSRIYDLDKRRLLAELDLNTVYEDLYSKLPEDAQDIELNISAAAVDMYGNIVLKMFFRVNGTTAGELGVWTGEDYVPMAIASQEPPRDPFPSFNENGYAGALDVMLFGPGNQLLLAERRFTMTFYERDPSTGGYTYLADYDAYDVERIAGQAKREQMRSVVVLVAGLVLSLCLLALLYNLFVKPRAGRSRT